MLQRVSQNNTGKKKHLCFHLKKSIEPPHTILLFGSGLKTAEIKSAISSVVLSQNFKKSRFKHNSVE